MFRIFVSSFSFCVIPKYNTNIILSKLFYYISLSPAQVNLQKAKQEQEQKQKEAEEAKGTLENTKSDLQRAQENLNNNPDDPEAKSAVERLTEKKENETKILIQKEEEKQNADEIVVDNNKKVEEEEKQLAEIMENGIQEILELVGKKPDNEPLQEEKSQIEIDEEKFLKIKNIFETKVIPGYKKILYQMEANMNNYWE
ncbi:MAG: hypothetical protein GY830_10965 [Bacteroidetes bacterium]|nr:hypothetical protein [Bacteroidota bacterium]